MRGGRHATHGSIVFQFNRQSRYTQPEIEGKVLSFKLLNSATKLKSYRKYKTFDAWVRLKEEDVDILVSIGIPDRFMRYGLVLLKNPHRLVINLYIDNKKKELQTQSITNSQASIKLLSLVL